MRARGGSEAPAEQAAAAGAAAAGPGAGTRRRSAWCEPEASHSHSHSLLPSVILPPTRALSHGAERGVRPPQQIQGNLERMGVLLTDMKSCNARIGKKKDTDQSRQQLCATANANRSRRPLCAPF